MTCSCPHPVRPAPASPRRGVVGRVLVAGLVGCVRAYQVVLGPFLGGRCRFYPSCSRYAIEALTTHGPLRGTWLTARRLSRCHPLGGHGIDLVPPARTDKEPVRTQFACANSDRRPG